MLRVLTMAQKAEDGKIAPMQRLTKRPANLGRLYRLCKSCNGTGGSKEYWRKDAPKCTRCDGRGIVVE